MKKLSLFFVVIFFVSACTLTQNTNTNNNGGNNNGYVDPVRPSGDVVRSFSGNGLELELFYDDGTYTYFGTAQLPTPCHELKVDSLIAESFPEQVTLEFNAKASDTNCAQVITPKTFIGEVSVSKDASFYIKYNGEEVTEN